MFIENFEVTKEWLEVASVNTGDSFYLQNTGEHQVEFIVTDDIRQNSEGGILLPKQQLRFKKVNGDLYVKSRKTTNLYIEQVE